MLSFTSFRKGGHNHVTEKNYKLAELEEFI